MKRLLALLLATAPASAQTVTQGPAGILAASAQGTCCGGATTETNIATILIPAGALGTSGFVDLKCLWNFTNSANNKSLVVRFNTTAGAVSGGSSLSAIVQTASSVASTQVVLRNTATNAQVAYGAAASTPFGTGTSSNITPALDTTANTYINLNGITATGSETITLTHCSALIAKAP